MGLSEDPLVELWNSSFSHDSCLGGIPPFGSENSVPLNPMVNHRVPIFSDIFTKKNGGSLGQTHPYRVGPPG